jgi:2-polyprenyl-3-methyl-5-hydroxy-6-metoxy-1,4-benzoquinol methylase
MDTKIHEHSGSPDPLIPPLQDNDYLISLLADVTGADHSSVAECLQQEHLHSPLSVSEAFNAKGLEPYVWSQGLLDFYKETDSFLYEDVVWNQTQRKCGMRHWILDFLHRHEMPHGRILICGDGIGVDSFFFAQAGYEVVFYEISRYGQQMAKRLFDDYHVNVEIADSLTAFEPESFDAVFSLDVLEHVPSPPEAVSDLTKLLRPGGFFVVSAPFCALHPRWPTHLKSNRKYSGRTAWLSQAGQMKLIDGRTMSNPLAFQKHCGGGKESTFSLFWQTFVLIFLGRLFLRFSAVFPAPIMNTSLLLRRCDNQLKRLMPKHSFASVRPRWHFGATPVDVKIGKGGGGGRFRKTARRGSRLVLDDCRVLHRSLGGDSFTSAYGVLR